MSTGVRHTKYLAVSSGVQPDETGDLETLMHPITYVVECVRTKCFNEVRWGPLRGSVIHVPTSHLAPQRCNDSRVFEER